MSYGRGCEDPADYYGHDQWRQAKLAALKSKYDPSGAFDNCFHLQASGERKVDEYLDTPFSVFCNERLLCVEATPVFRMHVVKHKKQSLSRPFKEQMLITCWGRSLELERRGYSARFVRHA